jgi:LuxR family maltose regulon positive regulatory protein
MMTTTSSKPVASHRARPQRLARQRVAQVRTRKRPRPAGTGGLPLLDDKLRVPRLTLAVLRRRRLTELLDAAAAHRVTLVSGPAGAGKTVACAAWAAARHATQPAAWLTADGGDRDPARFWQYVLAALVRARALTADQAAELAAGPPEGCPNRIVAALRRLPEPVVLVIDDAHELAGSAALAGLDQLIKHAPAGLRLVLAGRCPPGLALARLRVAGELADIGAADLACTAAEADAYFAMLGLSLPEAQRDQLLDRTEGWMAGLRLAAMAQTPGAEQVLVDYVSDEVLARQPADIRAFLLRTSVAPTVTGDLADALTLGAGGARTLERLARENSLVEPAGQGRAAYRYHPMLREVLAVELRRELPGEVAELLRRAARWHAARGQAIEAVRAAVQAGDWELGAQILTDAGAGILARDDREAGAGWTAGGFTGSGGSSGPNGPSGATGRGAGGAEADAPAELEAVLAGFPPDWRAGQAPVAAALAAARLWQGDPHGAAPHLDCARRSLGRMDAGQRRAVEPWLFALVVLQGSCRADAGPGWLDQQHARAEQAEAAAAAVPEYRATGLLWFALGCARLRRWETAAARQALARACSQLAAGSLPGLRARALAWQALAAARYGDLAAADAMIAEAGQDPAAEQPGVGSPLALARAQVSLARDELDPAHERLEEAVRHAGGRLAGEPAVAEVGALIRAQCAVAEGDTAQASAVLTRLREADEAGKAGQAGAAAAAAGEPLGEVLTMLEAEIALAAGEREQASRALADPAAARLPARADGQLSRARLLLATGDDKGALAAAQECLADAAAGATRRDRVAALLTAAVAQRRLSQVDDAAESIEQALAAAEPDGAYRAFLDGGQAVRSALTVLVPPTSARAGFAGRVLERFDGQLPRTAAAPPGGQAELPLTGSELAVLRFLPSHMTNQEIAEALFLSINTVKTHLRSAYRKLGVANRRQAIARGRRLDLL